MPVAGVVTALYAKRDDPFDIRFGCDLPAPDGYDRLGEVDAGPGGMLVACADGFRLMVSGWRYDERGYDGREDDGREDDGREDDGREDDGRVYDALAVATGATELARLSATNEAEAHALAKVTGTHAAAVALVPDILAGQPHCPRHRAPCERCQPGTPRARWLAKRHVHVCVCEDEPCGCGVSAFLAAASVSTIAMTRGALAILEAIDAVHGKA